MKRRSFITLLGGATAVRALPARAQAGKLPTIGALIPNSPDGAANFITAFRGGLSEVGYVEGQNVAIEFRWVQDLDQLPAMATDLVRRQVAVIAAISPNLALAAKAATTTIPIVFQSGFDPVDIGLVASLNRPTGNLTGISRMANELIPKLLELVREVVPNVPLIAFLMNPTNPNTTETQTREVQAAARSLGLQQVQILNARTESDIDAAFTTLIRWGASALVIGQNDFFNRSIKQLAASALRYKVPTIYSLREFAVVGGLMSYGASLPDQYRLVGVYVGRILKGARPADLPVMQSTKFDLVINLKTANALNLAVPQTLLATADEVIE